MFGLLLAIFPTAVVVVLVWLLHQKGLFDPLYDWWEDHFWTAEHIQMHRGDADLSQVRLKKHHKHDARHHKHDARHHKIDAKRKRRSIHGEHKHKPSEVIIIIIFTTFIRTSTNMVEIGIQVSCSKFTWTEEKMI